MKSILINQLIELLFSLYLILNIVFPTIFKNSNSRNEVKNLFASLNYINLIASLFLFIVSIASMYFELKNQSSFDGRGFLIYNGVLLSVFFLNRKNDSLVKTEEVRNV